MFIHFVTFVSAAFNRSKLNLGELDLEKTERD
jgi:hypothetical protein